MRKVPAPVLTAFAIAIGFVLAVVVLPLTIGKPPESGERQKAIWEPVNVKEDLELLDVYFANENIGWVAGGANVMQGGVVLYTSDGGEHWSVQVGDPHSTERAFRDLFFLGATNGWVVQGRGSGDHKLFRTTDGKTWAPIGEVPEHRGDYVFVSPTRGFLIKKDEILVSQDAGKQWKRVFQCRPRTEVDGLTRDVDCQLETFHFPTPQVGYALGKSYAAKRAVMAKTVDGGATWNAEVVNDFDAGEDAWFLDENHGFVRSHDGKGYATTDGGKTWGGVAGMDLEGRAEIGFVDSQVGWAVGSYGVWNYTTDGGRHWTSRKIKFPANISAFSLPARHRGYVVGNHGMVYRYRAVPEDYKAKGVIDAVMMPAR